MTGDVATWLARGKQAPLFEASALPLAPTDRSIVELIPHRPPMLLLDQLTRADPLAGRVAASRHVSAGDAVFLGHFPGAPIYPGVLLLEAMGQACLGLAALRRLANDEAVGSVRLVRIRDASFRAPVRPGDDIAVLGALIDDGMVSRYVAQVLRGSRVCALAALDLLDADA